MSAVTDDMLGAHIAIVGTTGGGKSYTARGVVERLVDAGRRVCVLDPVGVWWGAKANAAGDGPGLPLAVFGGDHADVAIGEGSGVALGRLLADRNLASVVDTSDMGVNERTRFLTAFLGELYRRNRKAMWLVLEEADEIAPQGGAKYPGTAQLLDAADRLVRRGRARGFRVVMISQRPAVIHKNVLTQINTLIAHRLTAPQDTTAIMDWIRANADTDEARGVIASLPKLDTGEAWVWSPGQGVLEHATMPPNRTFDSTRTPGADEDVADPVSLAEVDTGALREALADAGDSTAKASGSGASADEIAAAERRGWEIGRAEARDQIAALSADLNRHRDMIGVLMRAARQFLNGSVVPDEALCAPQAAAPGAPAGDSAAPRQRQPSPRPARARDKSDAPPSSARKILAVLDTNPPVRYTWGQACALAGIRPTGGHFNAGRKWLRDSGRIVEDGESIRIAEPSADAPPLPADPEERARRMVENWQAMLGNPCDRILRCLSDGEWSQKDTIAISLGLKPTGGHWNNAWATLRRNKLIEESPNSTLVRLAEWLRTGSAAIEEVVTDG